MYGNFEGRQTFHVSLKKTDFRMRLKKPTHLQMYPSPFLSKIAKTCFNSAELSASVYKNRKTINNLVQNHTTSERNFNQNLQK